MTVWFTFMSSIFTNLVNRSITIYGFSVTYWQLAMLPAAAALIAWAVGRMIN